LRLTKERIIEEALQLLNEGGLQTVTLRKIAKKLNVYASALYWHFKNKDALVNEMAETIISTAFIEKVAKDEKVSWEDLLTNMFVSLRKALLTYEDGARVVMNAQTPNALAQLTEDAMYILINENITLHDARLMIHTAIRYTFGFVIEEQAVTNEINTDSSGLEQFKIDYPLTYQATNEYITSNKTMEDVFKDGLRLIISY